MKIKFLIIPIILLAFACQNATKEDKTKVTEAKDTAEIEKVNVQKVQLNINGMTCTGCENAIQKTINEFDGVYSSKADHQKGIAIVEIDSTKIDLQKVESAINELGYEAKGHEILTK
ncbi:MAG: cation transporter [Bacteroidales bacterium]